MKKHFNTFLRPASISLMSVALTLCAICAHGAGNDQQAINFDSAREFQGLAVSQSVIDVKYGYNDEYRGIIWYTASPGEIFHGPVIGADGKVIKEGDPLIKMYTDYPEMKVREKQSLLDQAKADLQIAREDYNRLSKLVKIHSVSEQAFQKSEADYYDKQAAVRAAETALEFRKIILQLCTYNAQFDGIVNKVYLSSGVAAGEPKVLNISQLVPMGIKVNMDREVAALITPSTPVTVYPDPAISKAPVGINQGYSYLVDDGIMFEVPNPPVTPQVKENGKLLPVVMDAHIILGDNYGDINNFAVNSPGLHKDSKGDFVWKAVGQKSLQPGGRLARTFPVKKVYLELTGKQVDFSPGNRLVLFKANPELKPFDVVITDVPDDFIDGGKVVFCQERYAFMPGDKVKVVIGPNRK